MTRRWLGLVALLACTPHEHAREPQSPCAEGMVLVEGGGLGSAKVERFCLDVTEVTTAAYGACVHAGACTPAVVGDVAGCNLTRADRGDHPVNCVDFEQARAYCSWLGKRLPVDEEWMHAARSRVAGGTWPWGAAPLEPSRACVQRGSTCPVGQHPTGASPEGVQDLAGNVAEWTVHAELPHLRGGSWREDPAPGFVRDPPHVPTATTGVRCVVAPFTAVDAVDLAVWTPYVPGKAELPVLAAPSPRLAPERPLANLQILRRTEGHRAVARWWPVGDDWLAGFDDGQPDVLGLPGVLEVTALPEGLRDFSPVRSLGPDVLLMRAGWASSLRFVAVERGTSRVRWQIPFANYGATYEQFVTPRTFVAENYGQHADTIIGFGLADGRELWRIAGGEQAEFTRAGRLWTDDDRGYVRGDRGLLAFDPNTGAILWSGVRVGDGCGVLAEDGVLLVEEPGRDGPRRLDPATGAELGRFGGGGARCVWAVDPIDGGAAPAVLEDSRLFAFEVPDRRGKAELRARDVASGRELWRRGGLDPHVLLADHDAVYVRRADDILVALDAATGAPQVEISLAGEFDLSLLSGGGPRGPLLLANGHTGTAWLLGRGEQPSAPEAYTVRGRLVPDGLSRRQVRGVPVRVGERLVRSDAAGRFSARGVASGAIAVGVDEDRGPGTPGGSTVRFDAVTVVLDGSGTYDLGDVPLYPWYTE
ncbi:PQQ-like domain-containing protein [Nannocystis exedens]|uniref:PQQ-like domain-containing protein n=1 Tax=Nannocystis exedens TaxID=54 RepID=A0A1I1WKP0_9BACT|nr:SUMF1/EgtB/PvdO family nonheme iron enzyme [Nannocystis exedens]PCC67821.1 Serine/threonine-protein kinase pkn1 [Nannocystis exedens]SFD95706.1 PQQ-like domain-containing protein [Nannocystis exedens]